MRTLILGLVLSFAACAKAPERIDEAPAQRSQAVGEWLRTVRTAHANTDAARSAELKSDALRALRELAGAAVPPAVTAHDAASVRRDLYARAARVALDLAQVEEAAALTRDGLAHEGSDPCRTQLLPLAAAVERAQQNGPGEAAALRAARESLGLQ